MNKIICLICIASICIFPINVVAEEEEETVKSSILIEASTKAVLSESNADEKLPVASITKIMTMLITMEAIKSGKITMDDTVTVSSYASSMTGTRMYLEPNEKISVRDLLKGIAVASANDGAVAIAEHIMGSEEAFVDAMNERAKALGMNNTLFSNPNGLDDDNKEHYSTARDVSIMSAELLKYEEILPILSIWTDTLRDGKFALANTNKLIRFYDGAIGIKTGSTEKAGCCLAAAATRNEMTLISVVLGAKTSDLRFSESKKLLNYGFDNYEIKALSEQGKVYGKLQLNKGKEEFVDVVCRKEIKIPLKKGGGEITEKVEFPSNADAPVDENTPVGALTLYMGDEVIEKTDLYPQKSIGKITFGDVFLKTVKIWSFCRTD